MIMLFFRKNKLIFLGLFFLTLVFGISFWQQKTATAFTNPFDAGLFVVEKTDGIAVWNTDTLTSNEINIDGMGDTLTHPFFDPDGNVYIFNMNTFSLNCYTKKSNYTQACLNPSVAVAQPLLDGLGVGITFTMDNHRNIWSPLYFNNSPPNTGATQIVRYNYDNIAKTYTASDYHAYEITGKTCNLAYDNDYTACHTNGGTMSGPGGIPVGAFMDYKGNVWVNVYTPGKVVCLDGSNDYTYCQGSAFEDGRGIISMAGYPVDMAVDKYSNIYIGNNNTDQVKVVHSGANLSDYYIDYIDLGDLGFTANNYIAWLEIDNDNNRLYVLDSDHDFNCINLITITSCGEVLNYASDSNGTGLFMDRNYDLWTVDGDNNKLIRFDFSNNYAATPYTPATGSYFSAITDPSGYAINNLCKYLGGCTLTDYTDINISGLVDPILKFDIVSYSDSYVDTSTCALGTLLANTVASCQYRIGVGTNGSRGFTTYIQDTQTSASLQGLRANSYASKIAEIDPSDYLVDGDGGTIEEYGLRVDGTPPSGVSAGVNFAGNNDKPIPYSSADIILSAATPIEYIKDGDNADTTIIKHSVIIQQGTPAGYYTQTIRYTVTGNF